METIMRFFENKHQPRRVRGITHPINELAREIDGLIADGAEKSAGLRKLLEARDCFQRAVTEPVISDRARSTIPGWEWVLSGTTWELLDPSGDSRCDVYENGVWHTWDEDGVGGENDSEDSILAARQAGEEAVIRQGWA